MALPAITSILGVAGAANPLGALFASIATAAVQRLADQGVNALTSKAGSGQGWGAWLVNGQLGSMFGRLTAYATNFIQTALGGNDSKTTDKVV